MGGKYPSSGLIDCDARFAMADVKMAVGIARLCVYQARQVGIPCSL
jgi:hypothetical protein